MKAMDQTNLMIRWWLTFEITLADLAVRKASGDMCWHRDVPIGRLPLRWARAENAGGADVYVRPARSRPWPLVFLDDVRRSVAHRIVRKYGALAIETSPTGGCHVWLCTVRALAEQERKEAQRWLASRIGADPGSTSGEHLGRLAGFRNWKRGGPWVNVVAAHHGRPWTWIPPTGDSTAARPTSPPLSTAASRGEDVSASAREWGWVCGRLEAGISSDVVYNELVEAARPRRGMDAARYARHTVTRAGEHVGQLVGPAPTPASGPQR